MKKILIVIIIIYLLVFVSCSNDIVLTNQAWSYEKEICTVEFSIKSNRDYNIIRRIRIIAHSQRHIGKGAIINDVIGEKTLCMELKPREEKKWTGTINLFPNIRPSMVVITLAHIDALQ
ncbi:MAG: hypothetical protein QG657_4098 [Acidobacteriota bacterium]|nr:hypothetical protein [Acidobacteriota bacterium]